MNIGPLHLDRDSISLGTATRSPIWICLHVEHPWSECVQEYNAPARIYVNSTLGGLTIGLPSNRTWLFEHGMAYRTKVPWHIVRSQRWNPFHGSTNDWDWITFHPSRRLTCRKSIGGRSICGKLRWHPGSCRELSERERETARRRSASSND
jgi:hypothetical protein